MNLKYKCLKKEGDILDVRMRRAGCRGRETPRTKGVKKLRRGSEEEGGGYHAEGH